MRFKLQHWIYLILIITCLKYLTSEANHNELNVCPRGFKNKNGTCYKKLSHQFILQFNCPNILLHKAQLLNKQMDCNIQPELLTSP